MSYERITKYNSPNFTRAENSARVFGYSRRITGITIHHWGDPAGSPKLAGVISWLCRKGGNTSAHAVIESGQVAYLVDYKHAAWHSGSAQGNATTIGLELNPRASNGDYTTAAEHIADIWLAYGKLPLIPHNKWKATACPGKWDLSRLKAMAEQFYNLKKGTPQNGSGGSVGPKTHVVKRGETLWSISRKYKLSVHALQQLNGMGRKTTIIIGQKLKVSK